MCRCVMSKEAGCLLGIGTFKIFKYNMDTSLKIRYLYDIFNNTVCLLLNLVLTVSEFSLMNSKLPLLGDVQKAITSIS